MIQICIHGHFYQPSRVNPWTDQWAQQPSAAPFYDWNSRISAECYAPNSAARLLDENGRTRATRNNYRFMSFDFGPTLLHWMQKNRPALLRSIAQSDKDSIGLHGRGTAMAQAYHHPILPLCDDRDRRLEIKWGLDAFEAVFSRPARGLWMPETAMDTPTLEEMARQGVEFTVVDSHQIQRYRLDQDSAWTDATNEADVLGHAYVVDLPSGASITLVPYSRDLSHGVAFGGWLHNGGDFADRLVDAGQETGFVILATDGESYGHHHRLGEMALAYAIEQLENREDVEFTTVARWLAENPATRRAEIREPSSWSCAHGVGRWQRDCGCAIHPGSGFRQHWRGPLRSALEWLRDQAREPLAPLGARLFKTPELALEDYGAFLASEGSFETWAKPYLSAPDTPILQAQKWLDCHRHLLAMFTSCAWFFDDSTGLEPQQNLRHAACAVGLVKELTHTDLLEGFTHHVRQIPSNTESGVLVDTLVAFSKRENHPVQEVSGYSTEHRTAGVLHPVTAFDCPGPIGSLDGGRPFVDWMSDIGLQIWQILPLCPSDTFGSPYSSWSALSGDPTLVGLKWLEGMQLLKAPRAETHERVVYSKARTEKLAAVLEASKALLLDETHWLHADLHDFLHTEGWARDAAVFRAIWLDQEERPWWDWPASLRDRDPKVLSEFCASHRETIEVWQTALFLFERQWQALRNYANSRGVRILGDMPIYVARNSVDVWANRDFFQLDSEGQPSSVAGAPPDAYSEDGQLWGNPLFNWEALEADSYGWWIERVRRCLVHCDVLRIDHFLGFSRYWSIPSSAESAKGGAWVKGPGRGVFDAIREALGELPVVVEDLGDVDQATHDLRDTLGLPGMRVIQFGLDGNLTNLHHPGQYPRNAIAYSSTHDSPTAAGWWESLSDPDKTRLGFGDHPKAASSRLVNEVLHSRAGWAILPLADILGLGHEARINTPGTIDGNWTWRSPTPSAQMPESLEFREALRHSNRLDSPEQY